MSTLELLDNPAWNSLVGGHRAIAEILIRADYSFMARADLARSLQKHRLKSPDGQDVIDLLIRLLQAV